MVLTKENKVSLMNVNGLQKQKLKEGVVVVTNKKPKNLPGIPKSISVLGDVYPIVPLTKETVEKYQITDATPIENALGLCNQLKGVILIRPGMGLSRTQSTLLHEVMHVIVGQACLGLEPEKEEQIVTLVSQMLFETLRTNKEFTRFMTTEGKD